jgi:hypothetical protein
MAEDELKKHLLDKLTLLFTKSGGNIQDFNLPRQSCGVQVLGVYHLIEEELRHDIDTLIQQAEVLVVDLNTEQLNAFNTIVDTVLTDRSGFYFVSRYGGTEKTYLWNVVVTHLRVQRHIVLTVASSEVASLLLPNDCTAHSRFKIPCDLDDVPICNIKRGTMLAKLIESTSLVIWNDALMTHRTVFEALDRTFRDLLSPFSTEAENKPFGGKVVVLGGDARQILPVVQSGTHS